MGWNRVSTAAERISGPRSHGMDAGIGFKHVYVLSDLHTDYQVNLDWCEAISSAAPHHKESVLVVAGDCADRLGTFGTTMDALSTTFGATFFVPGNHDLWVRRDGSEGDDSFEKLRRLEHICESLGVLTTPQRVRMACGTSISILPLLSFHHTSFDTEPDSPYLRLPSVRATVSDFKATRWPAHLPLGGEALAEEFDAMNEQSLKRSVLQATGRRHFSPLTCWDQARAGGARVLSFSHFLPRIELIPEKRHLVYPDLAKAGRLPAIANLGTFLSHS